MAAEKLLAEWFWVDRWMGSSAFGLPLEARGLYREMLSQAWRRGAALPNDHEQIQRFVGVTRSEWKRTWPSIEHFWRVSGDFLVNDTQLEVYNEAQGRLERASRRGQAGAQAMLKRRSSAAQAEPELKPPSPSPSPSPSLSTKNVERSAPTRRGDGVLAGQLPKDHLTHAVCGRVCLPTKQFVEFVQKFGGQADAADAAVRRWASQLLVEWNSPPKHAQPIQGTNFQWWNARWEEWHGRPEAAMGRQTSRLMSAIANIAAEGKS